MTLLELVSEVYPFDITLLQAKELINLVQRYELRGDNPQAFNTAFLGIKYGLFAPADAQSLFDVFKVYKPDFEKNIKKISSINQSFNTISDGFNVFSVVIAHKLITSTTLPPKIAEQAFIAVMKFLNYKFFCGRVRTHFKHKANEGVMTYTIDNLSGKSDIKNPATSTWKLIIESHVNSLLDTKSPHYNTFRTFTTDEYVLRIITDMSTRICQKITNVAQEYYDNHAAGKSIDSTSSTIENAEGEKELRAIKANLESKIVKICGQALNLNSFINFSYATLTARLCNNVRPDMIKEMLQVFSGMATIQAKHSEDELVSKIDGKELIIGYRKLITEVIQKTYRYLVLSGVDTSVNLKVLEGTRNIFRASRIQDPDILKIKESVDYFVQNNLQYKREATQIAMRTGFILYLIILTF